MFSFKMALVASNLLLLIFYFSTCRGSFLMTLMASHWLGLASVEVSFKCWNVAECWPLVTSALLWKCTPGPNSKCNTLQFVFVTLFICLSVSLSLYVDPNFKLTLHSVPLHLACAQMWGYWKNAHIWFSAKCWTCRYNPISYEYNCFFLGG